MKDRYNSDDIDALKAEIDTSVPEDELPESLREEKVAEMLEGIKPAAPKKKIITFKRIVAVAAAFAVVIGSVAAADKVISKPNLKPIEIEAENQASMLPEGLVTPASYKDVEKYFKLLSSKYNRVSLFDNWGKKYASEDSAAPEMSDANAAVDMSDTGEGSYGKTNLQVEGVDEADVMKNDGRYIYLSRFVYNEKTGLSGGELIIVDALNPAAMQKVAVIDVSADANTDIGKEPEQSTAVASDNEVTSPGETAVGASAVEGMVVDDSVAYKGNGGNISEFYVSGDRMYVVYTADGWGKSNTTLLTYDISDKTAPVCISEFSVSGNYVSSRMVNGRILLITEYYVHINDGIGIENCIPKTQNGTEVVSVPCEKIMMVEDCDSSSYLNIASIDLSGASQPDTISILGGGSDVYCTAESLYIPYVNYHYDNTTEFETGVVSFNDLTVETKVFRFDIADGTVSFSGTASIPGAPLNQFSMDEYNGFFRIATTEAGNNVFILNASLEIVGAVTNIAEGEQIKAVRFMGDTAYVVTFFQTDPLFVIDVSVPSSPEILGELKIPGFSSYLHPVGENLLVGIGVDGDENGAVEAVKISLFDVSDKKNPKEIDKIIINDSYLGEYSHKGFLSIGSTGEYAYPVVNWHKNNVQGIYAYNETGGLQCFSVIDGKLTATGFCPAVSENDGQNSLLRGTYIGSVFFTVSESGIAAFDVASKTAVAQIRF